MSKEQEACVQWTVHQPVPDTSPTNPRLYPSLPTQVTGPETPSAFPAETSNTTPQPQVNTVLRNVSNVGQVHVSKSRKSVVDAYLLWLIFGLLGGHHLYLRRPFFAIVYFCTFGLLGCGWVIDLFRMPYLVSQCNKIANENPQFETKNISDAYTLWFPFGLFGFHHFYLGNPWQGVLYLFTVGVFGIGWLVDLIRIPWLVEAANDTSIEKREKGVCPAYMLGMSPLGLIGMHHFYLNRPINGMLYFFTFGQLGFGWLADWFRMPILVKRANKELYEGRDDTKYLDDAYTLWFPFGLLGVHHFYLKRPGWGALYFFTLGLVGIGWFVDGFRMVCLVKEHNKRMKMKVQTATFQESVARADIVVASASSGITTNTTIPNAELTTGPGYYAPRQPPQYNTTYSTPDAGCLAPALTAPLPAFMEQPPPYDASVQDQNESGKERF